MRYKGEFKEELTGRQPQRGSEDKPISTERTMKADIKE